MKARLTILSVLLITAASLPSRAETPVIGAVPPSAPNISSSETAASAVAISPDPQLGETEVQVYMLLGRPAGYVQTPLRITLMYGRGTVTLRQGVVTEVALMSEADYEVRLAQQAAGDAQCQAQHLRANALLDELMNDPNYIAMSTRDRLLALERFDREHPGSDADKFYDDLMAVYDAEQAAQDHLNALQAQLAQARAQTAAAQAQAMAQQQSGSKNTSTAPNPTPAYPATSYVYYVPNYGYTPSYTITLGRGAKLPGFTGIPATPHITVP
jgi:hypothetical protein